METLTAQVLFTDSSKVLTYFGRIEWICLGNFNFEHKITSFVWSIWWTSNFTLQFGKTIVDQFNFNRTFRYLLQILNK